MKRRMKQFFCMMSVCMLLCTSFLQMETALITTYAAEIDRQQVTVQAEDTGQQFEQVQNQEQRKLSWNIETFAAKNMVLTKSEKQMFAAYYANDKFDCQESILYLDKNRAWCMEPSQMVGNVGSGVTYALANNGDALQWLKNRFNWSWAKSNNLSKAVYMARNYFPGDDNCNYVLIQNLIWSEITNSESATDAGRYLLTNGAGNTGHVCGHLDTKEKVQTAIKNVWGLVNAYHRMPSYTGATVRVKAGQTCWIPDTNGATKDVAFSCPTGLQITKGNNNDGIWIRADAALAGKSLTAHFAKSTIPAGNDPVLIYEATDKKRQTVGMWSAAVLPDYGALRVVVDRQDYLIAKYRARDAVSPSFDIHIEKSDSETGKPLANAVFHIYMDGEKTATVTTDKDGKAAYHWRGDAVYTAYYEDTQPVMDYSMWKEAYNTARNNVEKKVAEALSSLKQQTVHTWKVVECQAPQGYELNDAIWEESFDLNTESVEVDYTNRPGKGQLKMKKVSVNPELTDGNACYSLEGAVYGIYGTLDDAKEDQNRMETLITDKNGNSNEVGLYAGIYYVKEITAPEGYELCSEKESGQEEAGIHIVEIKSNETTTFTCKENPGNHPFALILQKLDRRTGSVSASGTASVRGAIFELSYYANTNGNTDEAIRKWYFKTDENGTFTCSEEQQVVPKYETNAGEVFQSDVFYKDAEGNLIYPAGTYRIREVSAPLYFQRAGHMHFVTSKTENADVTKGLTAVIRQEENGGKAQVFDGSRITDGKMEAANLKVEAYDEPQYGIITIYKETSDHNRTPLSGVAFKMQGMTDCMEYEAQTNADGKIIWDQLVPQKYVITEVQTANGKSLLKEPIEVALPMEMTWEETQKKGADLTQAVYDEVSGKYCFYNVSLTVGNGVTFDMPMTGGNSEKSYLVLICGLTATAVGIFMLLKRAVAKNVTEKN